MSRYQSGQFAKPENALKRAEELINVGQKNAALQALHDVITSKRHRTWTKVSEKIMFKFVELCVDMKKGRVLKEGLIQYRSVCLAVNVASLEEVIKHLLKLAHERAETAQAQSASNVVEVEDLEADHSPEDLMLAYVSAEKNRDRADRELVTPWFKFLWETYRTTLEILRNNARLEALYTAVAHKAFGFCSQYKRPVEFRRLCEILRNHLANLGKFRDRDVRDRPDLGQQETMQLYLDARFEQLKTAVELSLWQEAFRSVEDIHGLMVSSKRPPKPQQMAVYFARLTRVYWVSENYVYHGYAWLRLLQLSRAYNKKLAEQDLTLMASHAVLAALAVTPYDNRGASATHSELEADKERNARMAALLGFSDQMAQQAPGAPPRAGAGPARDALSRTQLMIELQAKGVLALAAPEVRELYALLETEFHPLDLCARARAAIEALKAAPVHATPAMPVTDIQLADYVPRLELLATMRCLQQVSGVYSSMRLDALAGLVPFRPFAHTEKLMLQAAKAGFVQLRIDHQAGAVHFGAESLDSERVKAHLAILAKRLAGGCHLIQLEQGAAAEKLLSAAAKRPDTDSVLKSINLEHRRALARKTVIERRKEEQEKALMEQEREEEARRLAAQRAAEEAERARLEQERRQREEERIRGDIEAKDLEEAAVLLAEAERRAKGKKGSTAAKVLGSVVGALPVGALPVGLPVGALPVAGDGAGAAVKIDKRQLMEVALQDQIRERQDLEKKVARLARQLDHFERARREEERPQLTEAYKKRSQEMLHYRKDMAAAAQAAHRAQWEQDVAEKKRLATAVQDKVAFVSRIMARKQEEVQAAVAAQRARLAQERAARRARREQEAREERLKQLKAAEAQLRKEREEAAVADRRRQEEERRQREEEEARAQRESGDRRRFEGPGRGGERDERDDGRGGAGGGGGGYRPPGSRMGDSGRGGREEDRWGRDERGGGRDEPPPRGPPGGGGGGGGGGGYVPPSRRGQAGGGDARDDPRGGGFGGDRRGPGGFGDRGGGDRWGGGPRRDDGPPRRDDGPPRRDDGPPRAGSRW